MRLADHFSGRSNTNTSSAYFVFSVTLQLITFHPVTQSMQVATTKPEAVKKRKRHFHFQNILLLLLGLVALTFQSWSVSIVIATVRCKYIKIAVQ